MIEKCPALVSINPFSQIDVQAKTERRSIAAVFKGFRSSRPAHERARTRDNALLMRPDDAAVDRCAMPEIIRINDQLYLCGHISEPQVSQEF